MNLKKDIYILFFKIIKFKQKDIILKNTQKHYKIIKNY